MKRATTEQPANGPPPSSAQPPRPPDMAEGRKASARSESRGRIVAAAAALFGRTTFDQVSVDEIAQHADAETRLH